jgi:ligand-binding sensor domain-containing protein
MTGDSIERAGRGGPAGRGELRELMRAFLAENDQDTFEWTSVTTVDGFPHSWIYDLFEDSNGTIWVGTWGGGLARYDGRSWTTYSKRDGLAGNAVTCIREDSQGRLWIGTDHGLTLYDGQRFTKAGLTGKSILTLHVDADDNVWAGTWRSRLTGGGLHRYDGRRWQSFGKRDGLPGVEILKVFEDSRGRIWVGTYPFAPGHGGISIARKPTQRDSLEQKAARYLPRRDPREINRGTS